ncbi:MAG: EAL domain-containing protein, partial [Loktanella sp.]|nr:EAL domain-containing protein [Loktanella sp.]
IRLGTSMGMTTNAEGIETLEQANLLRGQGCQEVQGFYFSKPLPAALISELLADRKWESLENVAVIAPLGARQA